MEKKHHFEEFCVGIVGIDRGVGAGDADLVLGENGRDVGDDTGLVVHGESDVIRGLALIDFAERA